MNWMNSWLNWLKKVSLWFALFSWFDLIYLWVIFVFLNGFFIELTHEIFLQVSLPSALFVSCRYHFSLFCFNWMVPWGIIVLYFHASIWYIYGFVLCLLKRLLKCISLLCSIFIRWPSTWYGCGSRDNRRVGHMQMISNIKAPMIGRCVCVILFNKWLYPCSFLFLFIITMAFSCIDILHGFLVFIHH